MNPKQLTQAETLFDDDTFTDKKVNDNEAVSDKEIEHIVDTLGISYDDARRMSGIETVQYVPPEIKISKPLEGISVELGARAVALKNIMATYNQLNRTMGANIIREYPDNDIDTRYNNPEEVREGMGIKAAYMLGRNKADLDVLNGTKELVAAGFEPKRAEIQKRKIGNDLLNRYGPGKAYAPEREKLIRKVQRTATMVNREVEKNKTA